MKIFLSLVISICLPMLFVQTGYADIQLKGYFIGSDTCAALQSIRKKTNPGSIHLTEDMAYEVLSKNKANATHYRIRVKTATPQERWVPVSCGKLLTDCRQSVITGGDHPSHPPPVPPPGEPQYILALSWQPAFCQSHQSKKECDTQTSDRYDATHFAIHGLWPQPRDNTYCNVTNNLKRMDQRKMWEQLPDLGLTEETYGNLMETMPGVASYLHRHEWIKHGTCYSTTPEEYYRESILLTDQINDSEVRDFMAANIGNVISTEELQEKFDTAFGAGAGEKVHIQCSDGLIVEIWIHLEGNIESATQLSDLLGNASSASPSCSNGRVDPVGF